MKTIINALPDKQDLTIIREFEIPVHLLYRAFSEADLVSKWMNTTVLKMDHRRHGSYEFATTDPMGNVYNFSGCIHFVVTNEQIIRTFEMTGSEIGTTLEVLQFESTGDMKSKLTMHVIYQSEKHREAQLKMPFAYGINMAHNRLEDFARTQSSI
jgi:uncharacterized protein YndB with AHSA1/START domain